MTNRQTKLKFMLFLATAIKINGYFIKDLNFCSDIKNYNYRRINFMYVCAIYFLFKQECLAHPGPTDPGD